MCKANTYPVFTDNYATLKGVHRHYLSQTC